MKLSKILILVGGKFLLVFVQLFKKILVHVALLLWATLAHAAPQKIVSLNLCTDQLLMLLADPEQIASLSKIADDPYVSPLADQASQYNINSGDAEEIYMQSPDLVLAGVYTEQATVHMLKSLGIQVEIFPIENNFSDIKDNIKRMGSLIGHPERATEMINNFTKRSRELTSGITQRPRAALYSANGYTTGEETLAGNILKAAGFENIASEAGIPYGGTLPLEMLVMLEPDIVVSGSEYPGHSRSEEILKHPALRPFLIVAQTSAKWVCGTPAVLDAVAELQLVHPDKGTQQ